MNMKNLKDSDPLYHIARPFANLPHSGPDSEGGTIRFNVFVRTAGTATINVGWCNNVTCRIGDRRICARFHFAMAGGDASISEIEARYVFQNVGEEVKCEERTVFAVHVPKCLPIALTEVLGMMPLKGCGGPTGAYDAGETVYVGETIIQIKLTSCLADLEQSAGQ
ncbi:hypothetical protein BS47DRAFT_285482 [Hydnum rufescens UP504]|uniref:Uncharacterized protein n=1 Tax=Hydnum rufescens UP504 TaxID=1448309 RepID=A0A9P6DM53_9AGAM|nr:hypothetical protein BS47DRAFT_285482 [Hydnum rufescens UP504]